MYYIEFILVHFLEYLTYFFQRISLRTYYNALYMHILVNEIDSIHYDLRKLMEEYMLFTPTRL